MVTTIIKEYEDLDKRFMPIYFTFNIKTEQPPLFLQQSKKSAIVKIVCIMATIKVGRVCSKEEQNFKTPIMHG